MNKWFRDIILIPTLITLICGFLFMLWGAWYTGVKLHAPFSPNWLKTVFRAPVPLWFVLAILAGVIFVSLKAYFLRCERNGLAITISELRTRSREEAREHDLDMFKKADVILPESLLAEILNRLQTENSYTSEGSRRLFSFLRFFSEVGNQFIDQDISVKSILLTDAISALGNFLGQHFFVYPDNQSGGDDLRHCLYPRLNVDRDGDGTHESMVRYTMYQNILDERVQEVEKRYAEFRKALKEYLYI